MNKSSSDLVQMTLVLNDLEREIILLRNGFGRSAELTQKQVGEILGIPAEVVSQKEASAYLKMRVRAKELGVEPSDHLPD